VGHHKLDTIVNWKMVKSKLVITNKALDCFIK
jgi:hypothetical protein